MKPLAIITARGGSKRIPKKNIREFCGKPIIAYGIEAAIKSNLFDEIMVSTDSEEIAEIAKKYGATVPFLRSEENSNDFADTSDVILEVLQEYSVLGKEYSEVCCIYPTAPFITEKKIIESYSLLKDENVFNVVPMVRFSFPPQRGLKICDGMSVPFDAGSIEARSQDLERIYHDAGQFYWIKVDEFKKNDAILYNHTKPYLISELEVQDIDDEDDWKIAELKYRQMQVNENVRNV